MIIVLMGVTASGKSTVGKLLAQQLGWSFFEGDDFHSPENIEKLRRGEGVNDEDRRPWLEGVREAIQAAVVRGGSAGDACSALEATHRRELAVHEQVKTRTLQHTIPL